MRENEEQMEVNMGQIDPSLFFTTRHFKLGSLGFIWLDS